MKKVILLIAIVALGMSLKGLAQDKYVTSANVAFNHGDLDEAKDDIDKAMSNPETNQKPKALWTKVQIYAALAGVDKYKITNPNYESVQALMKLIEIKPDYESKAVNLEINHFITLYYNDGVKVYNDKDPNKFKLVADTMALVVKLCDVNGGKRFEGDKVIAERRANAFKLRANCIYYSDKYEEAIPLLIEVKNNPVTKSPSAYENLIDAYEKTKHTAEEGATIQEARLAFPDNEGLRNDEINYFIITGKEDELVKKLEDAVAKDPKNADLQIGLASAYNGLANPKNKKKPANAAEYNAKAEIAYKKSVELNPESTEFNYFTGAFYYNQGKEVNDDMNAITGSSDADLKKYESLKVKRDVFFDKALPYIEKAYNLLDAKSTAGTIKDTEKPIFTNAKQALYNIYLIQSKMDKADAIKKKMGK